MYFRIERLSIVDVIGKESDKILNNLTTNHVQALQPLMGCETFITDVRGKTLGHLLAFRGPLGYRLVGAAGQSEAIASHLDRYTIREDSVPNVLDDQWTAFLVPQASIEKIGASVQAPERAVDAANAAAVSSSGTAPATGPRAAASQPLAPLRSGAFAIGGKIHDAYQTPWIGDASWLVLVATAEAPAFATALDASGLEPHNEAAFHRHRVLAGVPWFGIDLDSSNLPQEADRDSLTICFTKGCYLGQETVARLDALGQVQKKLVRWSLAGDVPAAGTTLNVDEKPVARLTSIACDESGNCVALAMTRRSHFDPGSTAVGTDPATGKTIRGVVI